MSNNQQTETTNETIDQNLETETTQNEDQVTDFNESTKEVTVTPEEPVKEEVPEKPEDAVIEESIPSMEQFEDQIDKSFRKVNVGDIVKGSVVGVSDTEVIMDIGSYAEGLIRITDYSNDPNFSIKDDVTVGDEISVKVVKSDDGEGNILLSKKQADFALAWEKLQEFLDNATVLNVRITQSVKGGVLTFVEGIRGFIPASQLSISYVENLDEWIDKEVDAVVITVDEDKNRLVLSSKQVELSRRKEARKDMLENLETGTIVTGTVDNIVPYGAFVKLQDGLSGLVHISQLSNKFVKSPNEVVKEGQEVTVKILNIKDGKINLSMKTLDENVYEERPNTQPSNRTFTRPSNRPSNKPNSRPRNRPIHQNSKPIDFTSDQEATTSLSDLLKDLDLE